MNLPVAGSLVAGDQLDLPQAKSQSRFRVILVANSIVALAVLTGQKWMAKTKTKCGQQEVAQMQGVFWVMDTAVGVAHS